jgi:hypothetical protein
MITSMHQMVGPAMVPSERSMLESIPDFLGESGGQSRAARGYPEVGPIMTPKSSEPGTDPSLGTEGHPIELLAEEFLERQRRGE